MIDSKRRKNRISNDKDKIDKHGNYCDRHFASFLNYTTINSDMMQKNLRQDALEIMNAGLKAIQPEQILNEKIVAQFGIENYKKIYVFGAGKGVRFLAQRLEKLLGDKVAGGMVNDIENKDLALNKIEVQLAGHPLPDKGSLAGTQKIIRAIRSIPKSSDTLIICLFTGGGSALFTRPIMSVKSFVDVNDQLIKSGADIKEINIVRKHLDRIKGGGFSEIIASRKCLTLLVSDVSGNNIETIASGPTVYDNSTIVDAQKILQKYKLPKIKLIETQKEKKIFKNIKNRLLATNKLALCAMKNKAEQLGYKSKIYTDRLSGNADNVGQQILNKIKPGEVLIAGGETSIKVNGKGKGGRNTHLCLAALPYLKPNTCLLSINSDGHDNTDAAGAVIDNDTIKKAQNLGLASDNYLENFDSYNFFRKTGDLIKTGLLPTNVADLILVLQHS